MTTLLVYAHPQNCSFNHALKEVVLSTVPKLQVSDLYEMQFKAVADWNDFKETKGLSTNYSQAQRQAFFGNLLADDIRAEQEKLLVCERLILQFPLWFFSSPAIVKGWMDRVFANGFAYDTGKWFETGLLQGRKAVVVVTTQSSQSAYSSDGVHGELAGYLKPIHHTLRLVGFTVEDPFVAYAIDKSSEEERLSYLAAYQKKLTVFTKSM